MRRIGLAIVLAVGPTVAPLAADAQQAAKVYRIGVLSSGSSVPDAVSHRWQAFLGRLNDLGWVVGQNLTLEPRSADQRLDRLPGLAAEVVQLNVSMILAFGSQAALAAKRATATIPIVMFAGDPVGSGLIASLARPGGNITGLTTEASREIFSKQLELLKEAAPKISRVGILTNRSNMLDATAPTAQALRLTFLPVDVRSPSDFDGAFAVLIRERVDALTATENPLNGEHRGSIVSFAAGNRLPTVFEDRAFVDAGGLMSYGVSFADLFRRLPTYMDRILKGAKPADLPVEQPTKFELVINMKTAKAIGLTIPQSLLQRADVVIE
jgi:putative tryptophan/tyrosine transport system substrate-binding protein